MINNKKALKNCVVVVTGGAGFIGSHLVEQLVSEGVRKIIVVDSLEYGREARISSIKGPVELIQHKIGFDNPNKLDKKIDSKVDYLFHLAAEKHNQSKDSPDYLVNTNVLGMYEILELMGKRSVKKIVFSSSLYVYGRMNRPRFSEIDTPEPITLYGITKLAGEHLLRMYKKKYGRDYIILRYFFVYGPKQYDGTGYKSVIVKNFERMVDNKRPIVCGNGKQVLDYIYVDDVIEATLMAAGSSVSNKVINVGSSMPTSINTLTKKMIQVAGKDIKPIDGPRDETFGSYRVGKIEQAKQLLGWKPKTSLDEGLEKTFRWIKRKHNL